MKIYDLQRSRNGAEWRRLIDALKCDDVTRIVVASIVAWDFFFHRPANKRWPHLDAYLMAWRGWMQDHFGDPDKCYAALRALDYPVQLAAKRRSGMRRNIREARQYSLAARV